MAEIIGLETVKDKTRQQEVEESLARAWECEVRSFDGEFNSIDSYAYRDKRMSALIEIKCRNNKHDRFPTVFLSMRKHLALTIGNLLYSVPSFFVVGFDDKIGWINVGNVNAHNIVIAGHADPRAKNDIEPMIEIPILQLRWLP